MDGNNLSLADVAQNSLNNAQQTQTILSNLGRFVAWAGNGAASAGVSST